MKKANIQVNASASDVLGYLNERFGLDQSLFSQFGLYMASKGRIYLGPKHAIDNPRAVTLGLLIARVDGSIKPTTNLFQAFGSNISKNVITLSRDQAIKYAKGEDLQLHEDQLKVATDGYILLSYERYPMGCGHLRGGMVKNMLPKAKRLELRYL